MSLTNEEEKPLACGTCKHFHKRPTDLTNLALNDVGECRGGPPAFINTISAGQVGIQNSLQANYPVLRSDFPACRLHEPTRVGIEA